MADNKPSYSSSERPEDRYWFARHSKSIIFLILTLAVVGVYEALSLPIAVFPATNFPRIIVGVENEDLSNLEISIEIGSPQEKSAAGWLRYHPPISSGDG